MTFRLCLLLLVALVAWAETPVASLTSPSAFDLNGVRVPAAGVAAWPLVAGDELSTGNGPAVLVFADRSRATLDKHSRVRLERHGQQLHLRLLDGALRYGLVPRSTLRLFARDVAAVPQAGKSGVLSVAGGGLELTSDFARPDVELFSPPRVRSPKSCPEPPNKPPGDGDDKNCGKGNQ